MYFFPELSRGEDEIFLLYALHRANAVRLCGERVYHYRVRASGAINKWDPDILYKLRAFQERYAEFADRYFSADESQLMKQNKAIHQLLILTRVYCSPGARLTRSEIIVRLRGQLGKEPLKSAIKTLPLKLVQRRRRWQIRLLRIGLIGLWLELFRAADWLWMRKTAGQGHEMYP